MEECDFVKTDGGREDAGYKGDAGDCVTRAIAIATGKPYQEVYDDLFALGKELGVDKPSPRDGVLKKVYDKYLKSLGWEWTATMHIGSGCTVHLRKDELPEGVIVARLSKHVCAVKDGTVYDNHDPRRGGTRCVYGYYKKPESE